MTRQRTDWKALARPAASIAIIVLAYRVSLITLFESMRLDTPLAHLALVPFIAAGLAAVSRNNDAGPDIHDRQLDWIVGLFLTIVAVAANMFLPDRLSTDFWTWRVDLLTLPLFVAGVITLMFGTRTLWKYRAAVLFLFLAWPYPYSLVLDKWLGEFTQTTIWALDQTLRHIPLAQKVAGSDSNFIVTKNGFNVQMSVASACSGANGMVGFLLVASAFMMVVKGSKKRKFTWLALGATLVWVLNVVRIMVIFWSAGKWGERVAIDGFHPYVGLVVFNIAVIIMVLLLKPFGLKVTRRIPAAPPVDDEGNPMPVAARRPYRPQLPVALACVGLMSLGVGVFNGQLREYDKIANSLGSPRLSSFADSQETPPGWNLTEYAKYLQYERFFGDGSTWVRYQYTSNPNAPQQQNLINPAASTDSTGIPATPAAVEFVASVPIFVDVIETGDRAALVAYGVEQCYDFHGYDVYGQQDIALGGGLQGSLLTWTAKNGQTWTSLYWHWPIKTAAGTRYERVTLIMNDQATNQFTSPTIGDGSADLDLADVLQGNGTEADQARLVETRQFMVGFARELVSERAAAPE